MMLWQLSDRVAAGAAGPARLGTQPMARKVATNAAIGVWRREIFRSRLCTASSTMRQR
jgi:hypothetical protein